MTNVAHPAQARVVAVPKVAGVGCSSGLEETENVNGTGKRAAASARRVFLKTVGIAIGVAGLAPLAG